jgi:hypothetical protein
MNDKRENLKPQKFKPLTVIKVLRIISTVRY